MLEHVFETGHVFTPAAPGPRIELPNVPQHLLDLSCLQLCPQFSKLLGGTLAQLVEVLLVECLQTLLQVLWGRFRMCPQEGRGQVVVLIQRVNTPGLLEAIL